MFSCSTTRNLPEGEILYTSKSPEGVNFESQSDSKEGKPQVGFPLPIQYSKQI